MSTALATQLIRHREISVNLNGKEIPSSFVHDAIQDMSFNELEPVIKLIIDDKWPDIYHGIEMLKGLVVERLQIEGEL